MKKIFQIAKNELYSLFYSPIAWVLMVVFSSMIGIQYSLVMRGVLSNFKLGGESLQGTYYLTGGLITGLGFGIFPKIISYSYIFFPLITMSLISRETGSGTIKLLYSSPIRVREVVMGKFLAMMVFIVVLVLLSFAEITTFMLTVSHPDVFHVMVSLVGLLLVLFTYAAIGLFISSLTTYQIVAALITFVVFYFLNISQTFWQKVKVVRDITYYLNLTGKAENLLNALINLRDCLYFIILVFTFLSFAAINIKSGMEAISWYRKSLRYLFVVSIAFAVGYISSNPWVNVYYDATSNKRFTITKHSQELIAGLDSGDLTITVYVNLLDIEHYEAFKSEQWNQQYRTVWEPYVRFKPNIHFKTVQYYDGDSTNWFVRSFPHKTLKEVAIEACKIHKEQLNDFCPPEEVGKLVDEKREESRCFYVLEYRGRKTILRSYNDSDIYPKEDEIAAALNRLTGKTPKIIFMADDIERSPYSLRRGDYQNITSKLGNRLALINQGYDFDTLTLSSIPQIPTDIAAFVIADPRESISQDNLMKIFKFIDDGGNLLITTEPSRRDITKPLLEKLGLSLRKGNLIQCDPEQSSDNIFPVLTDTAKNLAPKFKEFLGLASLFEGDLLFRISMPGACAIDWIPKDGFNVKPLLMTDPAKAWNRVAPIDPDSLSLVVSKIPSDQFGSFTTAVLMDRRVKERSQRIIVSGDADYLSSAALNSYYTFYFDFWSFSYFSYGQFPANTIRTESLDHNVKISLSQFPPIATFLCWVFPAIIVVVGAVIILVRLRK